jgi:hypothetical protein
MTSSDPPTTQIAGYQIARRVTQDEIPSSTPFPAKDAVGVLGSGGAPYSVPPGVDVFELGIIANPGRFLLIPNNAHGETLWDQTVDLLVTEEQAVAQREIIERFYDALLAQIPYDAADLEAGVASSSERRKRHPVFDVLCRAALETWSTERRPAEPLDDIERKRLELAVARRAVQLLQESPPCRLDRQSLRSIVVTQFGCQWDRILRSNACGDHDDVVVRVLARIQINRRLNMPMSCIVQVLAGIQQLEIFFLVLRSASEKPAPALQDWLKRDPLGADPAAAELAVRVLYATWRMTDDPDEAKSILRMHVQRIQHKPISADASLIKLFLAMVSLVEGNCDLPTDHAPLFDAMDQAVQRWEAALLAPFSEIIGSLPEHAVDLPVGA